MDVESPRYPGLPTVTSALALERQVQADDFRALDAKAATVGVFAPALVALTIGGWSPLVVVAAVLAALAAWRSLRALSLRDVDHLDAWDLREEYLMRGDEEAVREILDSQAQTVAELARQNDAKAEELEHAITHAKRTAAVAIVGVLVEPIGTIVGWIGAIT